MPTGFRPWQSVAGICVPLKSARAAPSLRAEVRVAPAVPGVAAFAREREGALGLGGAGSDVVRWVAPAVADSRWPDAGGAGGGSECERPVC